MTNETENEMLTILNPPVGIVSPGGRLGYSVASWVSLDNMMMAGFAVCDGRIMVMVGPYTNMEPVMVSIPIDAFAAISNALKAVVEQMDANAN